MNGNLTNCDLERTINDKRVKIQAADKNVTSPAKSEIILSEDIISPENIDTRYAMLQKVDEEERKIMVIG